MVNIGNLLALAINGLALYEGVKRIIPKRAPKCPREDNDFHLWNLALLKGYTLEEAKGVLKGQGFQSDYHLGKAVCYVLGTGAVKTPEELLVVMKKVQPDRSINSARVYFNNYQAVKKDIVKWW